MGAFVEGEFVRVRWRAMNPELLALLKQPGLTAIECDRLLDGAAEVWGLVPGDSARIIGDAAPDGDEAELTLCPGERLPIEPGPSSTSAWLVGVQNASHCWAALPNSGSVTTANVAIDWQRFALSGTNGLVLGRPQLDDEPSRFVYPPSPERERQATLARDGTTLRTAPFQPEKGRPAFDSPVYRYGFLQDGTMRWLNLPTGRRIHPARPATEAFRAKLAELKAELARRGVFYMDAPDEKYHHRHSFEDVWDHIPPDFGEESPPVAYSVSGELDNEDKEERAHAHYIPDGDEVLRFDCERIGFRSLPSEKDITEVDIIYFGGAVAGTERSQRWTGWTICAAAKAVGLLVGWGGSPQSSISVAMPGTWTRQGLEITPPDADEMASRFERIAPAVATVAGAGLDLPTANAVREKVEIRLELILRLRGALDLADQNQWFGAFQASAIIQSRAPAEWAAATLMLDNPAAALAAVTDPFEVKVAFHLCRIAAERNGTAAAQQALSAARDAWNTYREPKWWEEGIDRWVTDELEPVLACGEVEEERPTAEDRDMVPAALSRSVEADPVMVFAQAWRTADLDDRDYAGRWLLGRAIAAERFDIAELLVADGFDIDGAEPWSKNGLFQWGGETPLAAAIEAGTLAGVRWCVERGADPAAAQWSRGRTLGGEQTDWPTPAVVLAAKHGQAEILAWLLKRGDDPVSPIANGITPLTAAAFGGSLECVELLLAAGADANQPTPEPRVMGGPEALTPLLYACDRSHDAVVRLLLDRGADPQATRADGELALQLAMEGCALETIRAMMAAGADGSAVNRHGLSVLHTAVLKRRADVLPLLLEAGASIDLTTGEIGAELAGTEPGWTALMIAAAQADGPSVSVLLKAGANPLVENTDGRTALDLARLAADPDAADDPYNPVIATLAKAERASAHYGI
ncbi:ankyrin repeat domain-containing protein [uncultured Sphingomonas sp.]|uniref:ankyrin repeat domain-containing protein n=1 Tax=uncultured Sphingomonas sp. TaxID=158754 RepID=UPI00262DF2BB|nr:ankyrin repeat domain-containing protein [uncultured Sphingomonas sp.]